MTSKISTNGRRLEIEPAPPADLDAEAGVLGACLIAPDALERVATLLGPAAFQREAHGWIYAAMLRLWQSGRALDLLTVAHELGEEGRLAEVGGRTYLHHLVSTTVTSVHATDYAEIVARCSVQRQLLKASGELARRAYAGDDPEEIIGASLAHLQGLRRATLDLPEPRSFEDVAALIQEMRFVWQDWLAVAMFHILAAEQEAGKSILALYIANCFLSGAPWPDGTSFEERVGEVLWCECESGQGLNYSRMRGWNLPIDRLLMPLDDPLADVRLDNPDHRRRIASYARRPDMRLIVVDSLSGATRRNENDSIAADNAFWLASLARDTGLPILAIHHLRKAGLSDGLGVVTLDRLRGHSGITQAARVVWALDIPDPSRKEDRRLSVIKSNLGPKPPPIGMSIDGSGAFFGISPEPPREESQTSKAADLMLALLASGPMAAEDLEREAKGAGISWATVKRAKEQLHIVSRRHGSRWYWGLPASSWWGDING